MGPSGCGKTTLLDVLAHRRTNPKFKINGDILVNGIQPSLSAFQKCSGYVEQEGTVPHSNVGHISFRADESGRQPDWQLNGQGNALLCC